MSLEKSSSLSQEQAGYQFYKDVRFWLILFAIARLYAITAPPLEFQHAWRQADGLMIARNFSETDANIMFPRVDTAGDKTGITGSEFPILNYLMYLMSIVFGYDDWYGRLIVLIFSTLGCLYFYKLIRKFFDEAVAFNATILLSASYWFSYSRKTFPDCFAAALCIMALYFVFEYLEKGKWRHLLLYILLASLGGLSKISAVLLLSVLAVPVFSKRFLSLRKGWTIAASVVVISAISGWYFVWVPYLNSTFGYGTHFTMGCPLLSMGWAEIQANFSAVLRRLYIVPMKYAGFVVFIGAVIFVIVKKRWAVFALFILPYLCFLFIILKTGKNVISDQYYVLTVIPVMAFIAGYGLAHIPNRKVMYLILIVVAAENIGDQLNDFGPHRINRHFANLESIADSVSQRNDLFVINSGPHCPTAMYFAHRKGWTVGNAQLQDKVFLDEISARGCKYVLICKEMYGESFDVQLPLPQIFESADFRIYTLKE